MKLLLIQPLTYLLAAGGAHKANRMLLEGLVARGHTCQVISATGINTAFVPYAQFCDELAGYNTEIVSQSPAAVIFRHHGVEVHALPDTFQMFTYVTEHVRSFAPDWILVSEDRSGLFFEAALKACPGRVVYLSHSQATLPFGPESFAPDPAAAALFGQAAGIITASRYIQRYIQDEASLPATTIPFPSYGQGPFPVFSQFEHGYVTMTNPSAIKGISIFLDLARALPDIPFAAVPTWATRAADRAALTELPNVQLLPATERIDEIFAQTRVLLVPSLWGEAFGQIVIDAMLRGIPVLSSNVGGLPEAKLGVPYVLPVQPIERYEETLDELRLPIPIVPAQDIQPWATALSRLLSDRGLYEELAATSRAMALDFVSQTGIAPFEQWLRQLAGGARRANTTAQPDDQTSSIRAQLNHLSPERRALLVLRARQKQQAAVSRRTPTIPRRDPTLPAPLSFAQQRLWFLDQLQPGNAAYNEFDAVQLSGRIDLDALRHSFSAIIERHHVLRSSFGLEHGQPVQWVQPARPLDLPIVDLRHLSQEQQHIEMKRCALSEAQRPFDLSGDLLLRAAVLRLADEESVLLWVVHHIALDGLSSEVLKRELSQWYSAYRNGGPGAALQPLPIQYADFAAWQREWVLESRQAEQLKYWRQQLADVANLQLPTDHPRPAQMSVRGARHRFILPQNQAAALKALSHHEGATLFMTLLAIFQIVLHRYSDQSDIAVGTPIANRQQVEVESLIGLFVNTLVLRGDLSGDPSFRSLLNRVRSTCLEAYQHQDVPFDQVVDLIQPQRDLSRNPLFQVSFVLHNGLIETLSLPGLVSRPVDLVEPAAKLDLTLIVLDGADGLSGWVEYCRDLFEPPTIARLVTHFQMLIAGVLANPDQPISRLALLTTDERALLLARHSRQATESRQLYDDVTDDRPRTDGWLPALIEAHATCVPDAIAVVEDTTQISYGELNRRANQLARHLRSLGVTTETPVGVYLPRSLDLVVSLLAILKAGGVYLPLDPSYPDARLSFMLADRQVGVLLTREGKRLAAFAGPVVQIDQDWPIIAAQTAESPHYAAPGQSLAYIIYTSGSTGTPKGVGVSYEAITTHCRVIERTFGLTRHDRVLQFASPSFDVSLEQILATLCAGAALVLRATDLWSALEFAEYINSAGLSVINLPPVYWREWVQIVAKTPELPAPSRLKLVIVGGDVLTPDTVVLWQNTTLAGIRLLNAYGPTEATITATAFDVTPHATDTALQRSVPIGQALDGRSAYILDRASALTPIGVPGELCLGGPLLARGYLSRPDLTAERFVPNLFGEQPGTRLYRTGDRARYLPDGTIDVLGRIDQQIKIRGYRIEIGEIEMTLAAYPGVTEALIVVRPDGQGGQRLVAYVVTPADQTITSGELRQFILARLPLYMVPATYVFLEQLPLLPSGKVDRRALPDPDWIESTITASFSAPRSPVEIQLARIWTQVLGLAQIGVNDNFFECGGDSISSLQVVTRARELGIRITPKQMFEHQTIAELALFADTRPLVQAEQESVIGTVALTPIQRRFFEQNFRDPQHWNLPLLVEVESDLEPALLAEIVRHLLGHHDALRARFLQDEAGWQQVFSVPTDEIPCTTIDLGTLPEPEQAAALTAAASQIQQELDLTHGPLLRVALFTLGAGRRARVLFAIHHLVVDSVSWRIILEDFQSLYQQLHGDPTARPRLPAKTSSFKQWADRLVAHVESGGLQQEARYWLDALPSKAPPLPRDLLAGTNLESSAQTVTMMLSRSETRALLQAAPSAYNTRINDLLLAALVLGCAHWLDCSALLVDIEGHGRESLFDDIDISRTVGWFTSIFPVYLDPGASDEPGIVIKRIKEQLRRIPHQGIGYGLLRYLGADQPAVAQITARPQAEILFNYLGQLDQQLTSAQLFRPARESMGAMHSLGNQRSHPIEINAHVSGGKLHMAWTYSDRLHHRATIERVAQSVLSRLQSLIEHCTTPGIGGYTPSDFPLLRLSQEQLDRLIERTGPVTDVYPLAPAQQGLLFHSEYTPGSGVYLGQMSGTLSGDFRAEVFRQAWQMVLSYHPSLCAAFYWDQLDEPVQALLQDARLPLLEHDWRDFSAAEQQIHLARYLAEDRQRDFVLTEAPLLRVSVLRLSDNVYQFVWTTHHLLLDGWSTALVLQDVLICYEALRRGEQPALSRSRPFRDYIAWLQQQDLVEAEAFWRQQLKGVTAPTPLPLRSGSSMAQGTTYSETALRLSTAATAGLTRLARQHQLTISTLLQAAWTILLSQTTGQKDIVFGITVAGRPAEIVGVERMVGMFINTLPVRVQLLPTMKLATWLQEFQTQQVALRQYEYSPLAEVQRWSDVPAGQPLFATIVVFDNYPDDQRSQTLQPSLRVSDITFAEQNHYPLTCMVTPGSELALRISYDCSCFDQATIVRMLDYLRTILEAFSADPAQALGDISLLSTAEQQQLESWNATHVAYAATQSLTALIEAQVARTPDRVALVDGDQQLTYQELNAAANRLAHELRRRGARAETLVGVCLERSADLVIALLGVLKAGAAYVPLDPGYPAERLRFMLADAQIPLLLTHRALAAQLPIGDVEIIDLDRAGNMIAQVCADNPQDQTLADQLAYMIYTSGSTGQPKGALNTHRGIVNRLLWMQETYRLSANDCVLQKTPFSFDVSVWEFFWPLIAGARIVVARPGGHQDPSYLVDVIRSQQVTTVHFVPAMLQIFLEEPEVAHCTSLRRVICSGEALPLDLQERFFARLSAELHNLYGPTEAAVDVTAWECRRDSALSTVPIGRPIANTQIHLLDEQLRPVPVGVIGELYIGGVQVARGYHGRPQLTAERFVPDPFTAPGARLYRTGDLARYLPDGAIEYVGRADYQIKMRGFRIELGEIEAALLAHPAIRETVVLAQTDPHKDTQLIAYIVQRQESSDSSHAVTSDGLGGSALGTAALRAHLRARLPEYMLPVTFITLDALPLTPNGKIDRRALPAFEIEAETTYVAPRTPLEEVLVAIWSEILSREQIGIHDNFFELGGHSLLATRVIARVRRTFQVSLPLRKIFEAATVAEFAEVLLANERKPGQMLRIALIMKQIDQLSADQVQQLLHSKGKS